MLSGLKWWSTQSNPSTLDGRALTCQRLKSSPGCSGAMRTVNSCAMHAGLCLCSLDNVKHSNNLKREPLEIQHPMFENSRCGFIESVYEG